MKFDNVKVPEGINVSRHNPLLDLFLLAAGVVVLLGALGVAAIFLGSTLARHTPVSWENAIAAAVFDKALEHADDGQRQASAALQELADGLAPHVDLPEGLNVTVHYQDSDEVNAFATVGGHVFINRGLIERMPSENALAMVIAHEMAHVANRDVAASLGGALLLQLVLAVFLDHTPDSLEGLLTGSNALLVLSFNREAERRADRNGLGAVAARYGHGADAVRIFEVFLAVQAEAGSGEGHALLSSHPMSAERIEALKALARDRGWPLEGRLTPLPPDLAKLGRED